MTPGARLAEGVETLGLTALVGADAQARLLAFLALLDKWNRTHNLTAIREPERMITHHLLDSLAVLPHLPSRAGLRVIDIGSGGGLPGIPLAIVRTDWQLTLLDSNFKKATFLRQAAIELPLPNVEIVAARVQEYVPATTFDIAISRAFSDLAVFAGASGNLLAPDGRLVAMKGVYPHEEIAQLPAGIGVTSTPSLKIPGVEGGRHLVIMGRAA
ncbi:MAG TPA: 16S rRNA (guanine(527)-N(7))-methyltransferase RsmG [Casimicrobiaceae bacterium]|jgi:16S rRNA (guanine527-N7)-methyltransferase|nr:16S rRNA (guanine(527)-N(7))-methyltransferase RsmG [Casimicrobiaceae bacterium]